jgi:tetratricopeptide (TPR) repeat protein
MKIFSIIPRPKKRKIGADTSEERKRLVDQEENASEKKKIEISAIGVMKQIIELKNKMNELENDVFTKIYITELEKVEKRLDEHESRLDGLKQPVKEEEGSVVSDEISATETIKEDKGALETVSSIPSENSAEIAEIAQKEPEIEDFKNIIKKWQKIADELKSIKKVSQKMELMLSILKDIPEKDALENVRLTTKIAKLFAEEKTPRSPPEIKGDITVKKIDEALGTVRELKKPSDEMRAVLEPVKVVLLYQKGIVLLKRKAFEEAKNCFHDVITERPDLKGAWLNKGIALGELGDVDEEIACYSKALRIDKRYKKATHNMNIAEKELKRTHKGV